MLSDKPAITSTIQSLPPQLLEQLLTELSSLASVYHKPPEAFLGQGRFGAEAMQKAAIEYALFLLVRVTSLTSNQGATRRGTGESARSCGGSGSGRGWRWTSAIQHRKPARHRLRRLRASIITEGTKHRTVWTGRSSRHSTTCSLTSNRRWRTQVEHGRSVGLIRRWRRRRCWRQRRCLQPCHDQRRHNERIRRHEPIREQPASSCHPAACCPSYTADGTEEQPGLVGPVLDMFAVGCHDYHFWGGIASGLCERKVGDGILEASAGFGLTCMKQCIERIRQATL